MTLRDLAALLRRDISRNALSSLLSRVMIVPLGLVTLGLVSRHLSVIDFGRFSVFLTVGGIAAALMGLGLGPTLVRFAAQALGRGDDAQAFAVLRIGGLLQVATTSAALGLGLIAVPRLADLAYDDSTLRGPLAWAFVYGALLSLTAYFTAVFRATNRFTILSVGTVVTSALQLAAVALLARAGWLSLRTVIYVQVAIFATLVLAQAVASPWARIRHAAPQPATLRCLVAFGKWMCLVHILDNVAVRLDILVLKYFAGAEAVGFYAAAYRLLDVFALVANSLSFALLPKVAFIGGRDADAMAFMPSQILRNTAFLALPMAFGVLGVSGDLVVALFGDRYGGSIPLLRLLVPAGVAAFLTVGAGEILMTLGHARQVTLLAALNFVVNAAATLTLIPLLGAPGAALATVIAYAVLFVAAWALAVPGVGGRLDAAALGDILRYTVAAVVMYVVVTAIDGDRPWLNLALKVPLGAVVYAVLALPDLTLLRRRSA